MPTMKPKRTLVFSSADAQKALEAALSDRCELHRTSMSYEIEQILIDTLIPRDGGFAERPMMRIYYGMSTVRSEISGAFQDNAAGVDWKARYDDERPLVELASQQSIGLTLDLSKKQAGGSMPVYHARSCWESVCDRLKRDVEEAADEDARAAGVDVSIAYALLDQLNDDSAHPEAKAFFDLVLRNWWSLGNYTYTFRALMDVVDMAVGWPETARSREDFKAVATAVSEGRRRAND